jgi:hypothetical protein
MAEHAAVRLHSGRRGSTDSRCRRRSGMRAPGCGVALRIYGGLGWIDGSITRPGPFGYPIAAAAGTGGGCQRIGPDILPAHPQWGGRVCACLTSTSAPRAPPLQGHLRPHGTGAPQGHPRPEGISGPEGSSASRASPRRTSSSAARVSPRARAALADQRLPRAPPSATLERCRWRLRHTSC